MAKRRSSDHVPGADASLEEALRQLGAAILNAPIPENLYRALHATRPRMSLGEHDKDELNTRPAMDQDSFRDRLLFSIGLEISRHPDLLRRILKEHVTDDAREQLAKRVLEHLELSGFRIDEERQVMTKRDHGRGW